MIYLDGVSPIRSRGRQSSDRKVEQEIIAKVKRIWVLTQRMMRLEDPEYVAGQLHPRRPRLMSTTGLTQNIGLGARIAWQASR